MTQPETTPAPTDRSHYAVGLADAALGAASHEMLDPVVRAIGVRIASGEITGDEAAAEIKRLAAAGHFAQ